MLLTCMRAFLVAVKMLRPLLQNEEPFQTKKNVQINVFSGCNTPIKVYTQKN